ncbi:MAG: glutathione S-transferase N-terminal domain-containing protein [Myxococcota bacterium]
MGLLNIATSYAASAARFAFGMNAAAPAKYPVQPLQLYEFEACPYCRKVREALTDLDLDAMVYPCPAGGKVYRSGVVKMGGRSSFPYLVDPNTGEAMYESDDINRYLYGTYGGRPVHPLLRLGPLTLLTSQLASLARPLSGRLARKSKKPEQPLELYSFEASPYCRIVRETLCELEIPYLLHNVGKGSPRRDAFIARSGKMQVPFLIDPNTGKELFESADIRSYLLETYS